MRVRDVNCAFRFYRKSLLDQIKIESDGAMINLEVYARARRLNARIKEIEVSHLPRKVGQQSGSNPLVVLRAFKELGRLFRDLR